MLAAVDQNLRLFRQTRHVRKARRPAARHMRTRPSFVFQRSAWVQMRQASLALVRAVCLRTADAIATPGIHSLHYTVLRCRRGVSSWTDTLVAAAPCACWQVLLGVLGVHLTFRGASWASGAAQAAQFVRIILRFCADLLELDSGDSAARPVFPFPRRARVRVSLHVLSGDQRTDRQRNLPEE